MGSKQKSRLMVGDVQPFTRSDGTVYYRGRIRLQDGTGRRKWIDPEDPADSLDAEKVRAFTARMQALEVATATAAAAPPAVIVAETTSSWFKRWSDYRVTRGLQSVATERQRVRDYLLPHLTSPMAKVTKAEVVAVRKALDARIEAGTMSWKTAQNTWGLLTKAFADAVNSKRDDLVVREDNPATGVLPPERGEAKTKCYLYPDEFAALVSCERVPLRWRRMFALVAYLYARPGEVNAIRWEDLNVDRGVAHIHLSADRESGEDKVTKTKTGRNLPIEPALLPLLLAMREEQGGENATGRLVPWAATDRKLSRQIKRCMALAGLKRSALFNGDATHKAMTFYDLRGTGITWCAVRGDDPLKIMSRAGHEDFTTTQGYIREAENLAVSIGTPFPPLPASLLKRSKAGAVEVKRTVSERKNWWRRRESNPNLYRRNHTTNLVSRCLCRVTLPRLSPEIDPDQPGPWSNGGASLEIVRAYSLGGMRRARALRSASGREAARPGRRPCACRRLRVWWHVVRDRAGLHRGRGVGDPFGVDRVGRARRGDAGTRYVRPRRGRRRYAGGRNDWVHVA
jgi:integrase